MTNKKGTSKKGSFVFNGYVNINIPATQIKDAESKLSDAKWVFANMSQAIADGYNLKVYHDADAGHYRASFTCMAQGHDNHGYLLGAYAGDWYTAIGALLYKHFDVAGEDWTSYQQNNQNSFG